MELAIRILKKRSILFWISGLIVIISLLAIFSHWLGLTPPQGSKSFAPGKEWFTIQRQNYDAWPFVTHIHLVSSLVFVLIAPFQFLDSFRHRNLNLHRKMGKLFVSVTPIVAGSGLVLGVVIPYGGLPETFYALFLFLAVLYFTYRGIASIKERKIEDHKNWMLRLFAWTTSVATMRIILEAFFKIQPWSDREWFVISLILALILNASFTEWWIFRKRSTK